MLTEICQKLKQVCSTVSQMIVMNRFTNKEKEGKLFNTIQSEAYGNTTITHVLYPYGYMAGTPQVGMGLTFNLSGSRDNQVSLPFEFKTKFKGLKEYEVQLGNQLTKKKSQTYIKFQDDGTIHIHSDTEVIIDVNTTTTGNATIDGNELVKMNLTVDQNAEVKQNLTVDQNTLIKQNLTVNGQATVDENLAVEENMTIAGNVSVGSSGDLDELFEELEAGRGNFRAAGDVGDFRSTMQQIRDIYNRHTHPAPGGETGPPDQQM